MQNMESVSFRLIDTYKRLKEEIISTTDELKDRTEKKVFDAYDSQKQLNSLVEQELKVLREKVISSEQAGGSSTSSADLGELMRLKRNGSIMEGMSAALLNQVVKECQSMNSAQFADRSETDAKIVQIETKFSEAVANMQRKHIQDLQSMQKMNPASREDIQNMQESVKQMKQFGDGNRIRKLIDEMQTHMQLMMVDKQDLAKVEASIRSYCKEGFVSMKKWEKNHVQ